MSLAFFLTHSRGQTLSNVSAEPVGDSVKISYRLQDPAAGRTYKVAVLGIVGQDTLRLKNLIGSVGDSIRAGQHTVYWDYLPEMGRYKGAISFHVRALPDFYISAPDTGQVVKRGKPITLNWYGSNAQFDTLRLELYQYDRRITYIDKIGNATQYTWKIPANLPPDEGYRIKVIGSSQTGIEDFSNDFTIKRAYPPYAIIVAPALLAGGLVWGILTDFWILPETFRLRDFPVR